MFKGINNQYDFKKSTQVNGSSITPADDSKVVHSKDMRKPANDVAGIEEVVHDNHDNTITANKLIYDLSKTGLTPLGIYKSGSFNDLPLGTVFTDPPMTDGPDTIHSFTTTTFSANEWNGRKAQIAIADSTNLMYFRMGTGVPTSWNSWVLLSDDSKVVHSKDMRKPASDVAGIEEVNAKQDKIGYTPADDSKVVHDNHDGTISVNGANILPANEDVIGRIDGTYKDMNDIPMGWLYLNGWVDLSGLSNWGLPQDIYYVHCFKTDPASSKNIQIAYGVGLNNTYVRAKSDRGWTTWKLLADDSKVVHSKDMRKPASDVAGIEEVNAKQDKIGYKPADDSKVIHSTITQLNSTDMNTVLTDGFYQLISGTNGIPSGDVWTIYQVIPLSPGSESTNGVQLAYGTNSTVLGMRSWDTWGGGIHFSNWTKFADDSKVAHLSGANNFDTVPTVNNNPLLLASSLPSDLARTGSSQEFTGKNTFDTAPIDKTTGNPYITKDGVPAISPTLADTTKDANFTGKLQKSGIDVATTTDVTKAVNTATSNSSKYIKASKNNENSAISDSTKGNSNDIYYWCEN